MTPLAQETRNQEPGTRNREPAEGAEAFFRAGHIEAWGRGIDLMMDECRKAGLPEPTIEEHAGGMRVAFPGITRRAASESKGKGKGKGKEKSRGSSKEKILEAIASRPEITIKELSASLALSIAGVEKNLRALKAEGLVRRVGPPRGGHWEVV